MRRWGRCGCDQARPRVRSGGSAGREQHTEPLRVPLLGTAIFGVFFLPSHLLEWGTWAWSPQGSSELGLNPGAADATEVPTTESFLQIKTPGRCSQYNSISSGAAGIPGRAPALGTGRGEG